MTFKLLLDGLNLLDGFEGIELLDGEIFKDLKTDLYPEISDGYKISNKNRIYSTLTNRMMSIKIKKHGNGYYQVNLRCNYENAPKGFSKTFPVHRLMMAVFNPVDGMEDLVVNHIDGNTENNDLTNLEWVTPQENVLHAINSGLFTHRAGEEASGATITNETARRICELFETGRYSNQEIADMVGVPKTIVGNIGTRNTWRSISKDFDFGKREFRKKSTKYTPEDVHKICLFFELYPKKDGESTRRYLIRTAITSGLMFPEQEVDENLLYSMRWIYKHKSYTKISSQYNF